MEKAKTFLKSITALNIMYQYLKNVKKGYAVYIHMRKKYGKDCKLILSPFEGCGDAYLMGRLFDEYLKNDHIPDKYVVLQPLKAGREILALFGVTQVECISLEEKRAILAFGAFVGFSAADIAVLHFNSGVHTEIMNAVEGIHKLDFFSMFSVVRLNTATPQLREPKFRKEAPLEQKLLEQGVKGGKTVVLFPKSNSIPAPSYAFWKRLSQELAHKGYVICTNVAAGEKPIEGTRPLSISIEGIDATLHYAGCFIGSRSGICEVISGTSCKKVIVYPRNYKWGSGLADQYFSLKNMGLCSDAIELSYEQEKELLDRIICHF